MLFASFFWWFSLLFLTIPQWLWVCTKNTQKTCTKSAPAPLIPLFSKKKVKNFLARSAKKHSPQPGALFAL